MDNEDETRKLILRLQREDLASIWASSTTTTDAAADLDADVSLRLYRQELRTAEQQIEDERTAQAAAQDELRQRDTIRTDREEARRLFLELNPNEPLPELVGDDQLTPTESSALSNALFRTEEQPTTGPSCLSEQAIVAPSPSLSPQKIAPLLASVKRSANHLDNDNEPPSKKQATGGTTPTGNTDGPTFPAPISAGVKRPAQDDDGVSPPAKRHQAQPVPKNSPFVFGVTQSTTEEQPGSAMPGPAASSRTSDPSIFDLFGKPSNGDPETPTPRKIPASRQPVAPGQQLVDWNLQSFEVECVACCRVVPRSKSYSNSCSHIYCSKCVNRLFRKAVRDDSLWPPQCCKAEMPIKDIEHFLHEGLIPSVKARQVEMSVPILERTYCVSCSAFIPLDWIHGKLATCTGCSNDTCTECKKTAHVGSCQTTLDQGTKELEALAETEGWKRCSTCMMIVEHNTGCNHMTCRCKNEFCYLCVEKWKDCKCPWFTEELLLQREVERGEAPIPLEICRHGDWEQYDTEDFCDHCGDLMPKYHFYCPGCLSHYCRWCTYNRGLTLA